MAVSSDTNVAETSEGTLQQQLSSDAHENASILHSNEWLLLEWVVGLLIDTWADSTLSHAVRSTARVQCTRVASSKGLSAGELLLRMGSSDSGVITNVVRILLTHSSLQPSEAVKEFHKFLCLFFGQPPC